MQLKIELTVDEVNRTLNVLADKPFREVADLIGKIKAQADAQFLAAQAESKTEDGGNG